MKPSRVCGAAKGCQRGSRRSATRTLRSPTRRLTMKGTRSALIPAGAYCMELGELAAHISYTMCSGKIRARNNFTRILLEPTLGTPTCGGQCPLTDRAGGIVKTQSISLARARELAHLVK